MKAKAMIALLNEPSILKAAHAAGVGEHTLHKWMNDDEEFIAAYRQARRQTFTQAIGLTMRYTPIAVNTLAKVMVDTKAPYASPWRPRPACCGSAGRAWNSTTSHPAWTRSNACRTSPRHGSSSIGDSLWEGTMALNHRLNRLERTLANAQISPARMRPLCGSPPERGWRRGAGWQLPERMDGPAMVLGCESCFAWVRMDARPTEAGDGGLYVVGATRCGPPEYMRHGVGPWDWHMGYCGKRRSGARAPTRRLPARQRALDLQHGIAKSRLHCSPSTAG